MHIKTSLAFVIAVFVGVFTPEQLLMADADYPKALAQVAAPALPFPERAVPAVPALLPTYPVDLVRVIDGDTAWVRLNGVEIKVRLACIDAPETNDLLGPAASAALTSLLQDKDLTLTVVGKDFYGRTLGSVMADGVSVGAAMATQGLAYYYTGRCADKALIIAGDNYAAANKVGMRSIPGYLPPWEQRRLKRISKARLIPSPISR